MAWVWSEVRTARSHTTSADDDYEAWMLVHGPSVALRQCTTYYSAVARMWGRDAPSSGRNASATERRSSCRRTGKQGPIPAWSSVQVLLWFPGPSFLQMECTHGLAIRGQVAYLVYRLHSVLGTELCTSCSATSSSELRGPGPNCLECNAEGAIRVADTLCSPPSRGTEVAPATRPSVPSCLHE